MTRLSTLSCSLFAAMTLFSCKKNHNDDVPPKIDSVVYTDYSAMKPGNYWIYQLYTVDSLGNGTPENKYDSVYAANDTVVNGKTYHILHAASVDGVSNTSETNLVRDSLNYIVDINGSIRFASVDFNTIFLNQYIISPNISPVDSVGLVQQQMADKNLSVTVPAGTFITSSMRATWTLHPAISGNGHVRIQNTRYAAGMGIITQTLPFYVAIPTFEERRLVRYHIQ